MNRNSIRSRMLGSTVLAGLMVLTGGAPAFAQTAADGAQEVGEVVVTGSRIRRAETTTEAPVTVIDEDPQGVWSAGLRGPVRLITVGQSYVSEGQKVRVAAR